MFKPSKNQRRAADFILKQLRKPKRKRVPAIIRACAGSGKSTTIWWLLSLIKEEYPQMRITFLAFNKKIADEGKAKLKKNNMDVQVATAHSWGLSTLKTLTPVHIKMNKVYDYLVSDLAMPVAAAHPAFYLINKIRELGCLSYEPEQCRNVLQEMDIHTSANKLAPLCEILKGLDKQIDVIDFNDMLRIPTKLKMFEYLAHKKDKSMPHVLVVDELQDFNAYPIEILRQLHSKGVYIIGVGDPDQSIYGFIGAINTMEKVIEQINAKELPLDETYRCKKRIVDYTKDKTGVDFRHIHKGGSVLEVETIKGDYRLDLIEQHHVDMVVSPKNKHLIRIMFQMYKSGIQFTIKSTTVLDELSSFFKQHKSIKGIQQHKRQQPSTAAGRREKDLAETALYFCSELNVSPTEARAEITKIKRRDKGKGVKLHTGHSSKGLEANCVMVIDDYFKMEGGQEKNLKYVCYTRAIEKLIVIRQNKNARK